MEESQEEAGVKGSSKLLKRWTDPSRARGPIISLPDPTLIHGTRLPEKYLADMEPEVFGVPLEDVDEHYGKSETFIVITRNKILQRFNASESLHLFKPLNPLRISAINILNHWLFTVLVAAVILANYVTRRMIDECMANGWVGTFSEIAFMSVCVLELKLKFISAGVFAGPFAASKSPWTWLDIFVIFTGFLNICFDGKWLDLLIAFRTLKIIPIFSGLLYGFNFVVSATVSNMFDVGLYAFIAISALALAGMQAFSGLLTQKCVEKVDILTKSNISHVEWYKFNRNPSHWLLRSSESDEYFICGNTTRTCPADYRCLQVYGTNPNYGYTSFDHFGWAALSIVRIISQDFMNGIYFLVPSTSNAQQLLFFILAFFLGTYMIVSFAFAIAASSFEEDQDQEEVSAKTPSSDGAVPENAVSPDLGSSSNWLLTMCRNLSSVAGTINSSQIFELFIVLVILVQITAICCDVYGIETHSNSFRLIKFTFKMALLIYVLEFLVNFTAEGPRNYFKKGWNVFEILMVGLIFCHFFLDDNYGVTILLIPLPVLKLASRWCTLRFHFQMIWNTLSSKYICFFLLALIAIFMFAEFGVLLFAQKYEENTQHFPYGIMPRWNFHKLPDSILMFTRVLTGEWIQSLWHCLLVGNARCLLFFLIALLVGYVLVMHMGLAIIYTTMAGLRRNTCQGSKVFKRLSAAWDSLGSIRIGRKVTSDEGHGDRANVGQSGENGAGESCNCPQIIERLIYHPVSRWMSIGVITISCIPLAVEDMYFPKTTYLIRIPAHVLNIIFVALITLELVLKLIAFGCCKFFTIWECKFDLLMLVERIWTPTLWIFFWTGSQWTSLNIVSALRPIMLIFRVTKLRIAAKAILKQISAVYQYFVTAFFIWILFAMVGHFLFTGKYFKCLDSDDNAPDFRVIRNRGDCEANNHTWVRSDLNFDNLGETLISLTAVATFNEWTRILLDGVDARGIDEQPHREINPFAYIYFILFITVGVFFLQNVLLGAVIHHFRIGQLFRQFFTEQQQNEYDSEKVAMEVESRRRRSSDASMKPPVPTSTNTSLDCIYNLVTGRTFEFVVIGLIVLDLVGCFLHFMLRNHTPSLLWLIIFWIITIAYVLELYLKIITWRCQFFNSYQNMLDVLAVLASIGIGVIYADLSIWGLRLLLRMILFLTFIPFTLRTPSQFKLSRRLILLQSISSVSPAILNLICLLAVIMASYGLLGMYLFKNVGGVGANSRSPLNFQTFSNSMLVLVELSMVAGWPDILLRYIGKEFECEAPNAASGTPGNCGSSTAGILFIFSYMGVSFLIVLNMFVLLVLEMVAELCPDCKRAEIGAGPTGEDAANGLVHTPAATNGAELVAFAHSQTPPQVNEGERYVVVDEVEENPEVVVAE